MAKALSDKQRALMDAYWRAANYLSVGQIYLYDNPLLKQPLAAEHVKPRLLGHWGTTPGQNFIYVHLNRVIKQFDLNMFYVAGPGHGGPALVANTYLEGTYSEVYPEISPDEAGMRVDRFFEARFPGLSFSHIQRVIRKGEVRVNGKRTQPKNRLEAGQTVRIPPLRLDQPKPRTPGSEANV